MASEAKAAKEIRAMARSSARAERDCDTVLLYLRCVVGQADVLCRLSGVVGVEGCPRDGQATNCDRLSYVEFPGTSGRFRGNTVELLMAEVEPRLGGRSPDRELVSRFRAGDREAFLALYRAHAPSIFHYSLHMTA